MSDPSDLSRRAFLLRSVQAALAASTLNAFLPRVALADGNAEGKEKNTLVVIFLRGGCDPLHMVIPYSEANYYKYRPTIYVPPKDDGEVRGIIPLNKHFGLHPALEPLLPWWENGQFTAALNVGSPHPSRSHFDCMDFMEYAAPGDRTVTEGWLNRFIAASHEEAAAGDDRFVAVALQGLLPRSLRGEYPVLAVPPLRQGAGQDPLDVFDEVYWPDTPMDPEHEGTFDPADMGMPGPEAFADPVLLSGRNTIEKIRQFREIVKDPGPGTSKVRYPSHPFGNQLKQLARVIKADKGLKVGAIDYGGWDHHAKQAGPYGIMERMLTVLAGGLSAFCQDLGPDRMKHTLVLTMSEFGRTVRENGNAGTDHGHGGIMLSLGGPVNGNTLHGIWRGLDQRQLYEERDLPVTTDFRFIFAQALESCFGFKPPRDFFPNFRLPRRYPYQMFK